MSNSVTTLRVACIQENPTVGDIAGNIAIIRRHRAAFRNTADLLVFSESFVAGYPLGDLVLRPGFVRDVRRAIDAYASEMEGDGGPAVLVGGPREGGASPFNSAYLIDTDGTIKVTDKHRLPNSEVYDERRTFAAGPMPDPVEFRGFSLGIMICEDYWHGEVPRHLVEEGADLFIVINGSHYKRGKQSKRTALARRYAEAYGRATIYVNQYCGQDELVFDGGTFITNRKGAVGMQIAFDTATLLAIATLPQHGGPADIEISNRDVFSTVPHGYPDELASDYQAMVTGLRDYVTKVGFPGVLLGMSGGIDSALTAAVAVDALGADKVRLVRLPSPLTSKQSMEDAETAASLLGCHMDTISITPAINAEHAMLRPVFESMGRTEFDVTEENIQARIRGLTLMALSNKLHLMVVTTGNKSEMSVGYATLYGDMCGGFSVLKDVYKTDVFRLADWRNKNHPHGALGPCGIVVPRTIIEKPPSAELAEGQTDEAALGTYEELDTVLRLLVEGLNSPTRVAELASAELGSQAPNGVSIDYVNRIARLVWRAQYKRLQAPPGVTLTDRDWAKGFRLPVVNHWGL